ncbi:MAG: cyclodeaminase/cyclohydrolase family protein [Phycisphaerales bacterium]
MPDPLAGLSLTDFLQQLGAKTPTPGGGAAACITGATGAALAQMVVGYSIGKKALAAHRGELERAAGVLGRAREVFLELAEEDAAAYGLVNELMRLPEGDARRAADLTGAVEASIQAPAAAVATALEVLRLCGALAPITNRQLHSDLAIAAVLAEAAARAGGWNIRVNAGMLADAGAREGLMERSRAAVEEAGERRGAVERACSG